VALADTPRDIIEACRKHDAEAIDRLIRLISPDLYRIIFSMVHDHDDTDEILQETLIRLFRYIHTLKDVARFPSWVMRIAVNQVQTYRVRKGRSRLYSIENQVEGEQETVVIGRRSPEDPRNIMIREQLREEISSAMASLPDRQRTATILFEVEGLSIREIAETLSCSEGAVKFNIHEGRKKLKRRLYHLVQGLRWGRRLAQQKEAGEGSG
jgi:RNA polymerase sigma-70 factor (ECF subfamily)